ncbi:MAG: hypothetical protein JWQ32_3516 [Marmoricola sp.]|nr:hypothetical protein [Marmoricola sp.]
MQRHRNLWIGFAAVHLWLVWELRYAPNHPLFDVTHVYRPWVRTGLNAGHWVGIDSAWVYPIGALVPMVAVAAFGLQHYGLQWLALVTALDAVAFAGLTRAGARGRVAAYWWLGFLAALGPIALGRIDAITIPLVIVALLILDRRPGIAAALLTFAAFVKVWPIAVLGAVLVAGPARRRIMAGAGTMGVVVVGTSIALGASIRTLSSFLTMQSGRGLQLESPAAVPWLWLKSVGSMHVDVVWRPGIRTFEVVGSGISAVEHALSAIMILIFGVVAALGIRASRASTSPAAFLGPLAVALTSALIVTNKVGSPQYQTWIAAPIVLGLLQQGRGGPSFRLAASLGLLIAALTQVVYPWGYHGLVAAHPASVAAISLRDALLVALLALSIKQLVQAGSPESVPA